MIALPDVNALIALAWPNHVHHDAARSWFAANRAAGWATCAMTEAGFVRVILQSLCGRTRRNATGRDSAVAQAAAARVAHVLGPGSLDHVIPDEILNRIQRYRQITDAVLVALAMRHGGRLATFDGGIKSLLPEIQQPSVHVIPVSAGGRRLGRCCDGRLGEVHTLLRNCRQAPPVSAMTTPAPGR